MNSYDYDFTGHRFAFRCQRHGNFLPPGKKKGRCIECPAPKTTPAKKGRR